MNGRILFLDIDGVILPTRMWAARENIELLDREPALRASHIVFDPGAIGLLNRMARYSGAKFVLHSNWRRLWPGEGAGLRDRLVRAGLAQKHWHASWAVPTFEGRDKALEIAAWLRQHGRDVGQGLIVDDAPIGAVSAPPSLQLAQLRPSTEEGLGMADYRAALKYFGVVDGRTPRGPAAVLWAVGGGGWG